MLIGGKIMSSTLRIWLNAPEPGWNNAGTGHSALAELNYTPEDKNRKVEIAKAIEINEGFQISRQLWASQVKSGVLQNPRSLNSTWRIAYKNLKDGTATQTDAQFVFIGAGGGALHLLQKTRRCRPSRRHRPSRRSRSRSRRSSPSRLRIRRCRRSVLRPPAGRCAA